MPLIFAIDSDKRQSAQLASLLRSHVDADLVQSASAVEGLEILQGRIPDLILMSSLLSPRDETALDNHLRELGVAAAHVQTLTIPVIAGTAAAGGKKKKPAGMLAALRREKKSAAKPSGCDPDMFAREVQLYLERAVEQRETLRAVLPEVVPAPVADAETAESLIAAATSVEPAVEPPTVVMLAPTVVALVMKQPLAAQPEALQPESVQPEPEALQPGSEPVAEPDPVPSVLETGPLVLLAEQVIEVAPARSIFSLLRDPEPEREPQPEAWPEPQPEPTPVNLLLVAPIVEVVIEHDPMEQLLAVPAGAVEAAEQLLIAPVAEAEPAPDPAPALAAVPEPEPEVVAQAAPALELAPASIEPVETETPAEPPVPQPIATADPDLSWSFDASSEESLQLDQLLQQVVEETGDAEGVPEPVPQIAAAAAEPVPVAAIVEPEVVAPMAVDSTPASLETAEFTALLAPPPTRIADAIRMPEGRVPTVDMLEVHDLDALADDFAAAGLTADLPHPPPLRARAIEPVVAAILEPAVEAVLERAEPVAEAAVVEAAPIAEIIEEAPIVEAPAVETPAAELPTLAWSWLEEKALPLADLFSRTFGTAPAPVESFTPAIETPAAPVAPNTIVRETAPAPVDEIYDPVASASWNLAATAPTVEARDTVSDPAPTPAPVEVAIVKPPAAAEPVEQVAVAEAAAWDPVSAAAWQAAVAPAPEAPPAPEPLQAAAPPEPEPDMVPGQAEVPDPDVPLLDPEVLAILGMAAHRAGLDAMETLDAPAPAPRAAATEGPSRRKSRQDRSSQARPRRDAKAGRKERRKEERPAQDEWGMFDPSQCGPAALFDDEEWADDDDDRPARPRAST